MKTSGAIFTAILMLMAAAAARAGVVVDYQETLNRGNGQPINGTRTVMVEGNKQKIITGGSELLIDLDNSSMYVISPERKAYVQTPFPPPGDMGQMMARQLAALDFKKTGNHKTVAGYPCDEYTGSSSMMGGQRSVVECFSDAAPGAAAYNAFQKAMAAKVHGSNDAAAKTSIPTGVPLEINSTTKITSLNLPPGMSPDQAAKIKAMLAKRPPITSKMEATKVSVQTFAASDFTVPAGYQKQAMPPAMGPGHMSMGAPPPPHGGNMSTVPDASGPPASSSGGGSGDSLAPKL